jgi:PBP1b-binding outer membrane lipoprotein LpoB
VNVRVLLLAFLLSGCTSQFALGPAAWSTVPPVIPGFTAVPLAGGGFVEEPNSMLQPPAPAEPPPAPIETLITGLEQAQKVRTLTRQLAR